MKYLHTSDIVAAFQRCGVTPGDVLFLHCDAIVLAQLPPMSATERYEVFFQAMNELLGPEGTLVLPSFTYSFTKGEIFDVEHSPSIVGALTEYFRTRPGTVRSRDPLFSVVSTGALAAEFAASSSDDSFGPESAFALLDKHNAWIACLGCGFDRITFTHYLEQQAQVDYRYFKHFSGTIQDAAGCHAHTTRYFVRVLERESGIHLGHLRAHLEQQGQLACTTLGRIGLTALRSRAFLHYGHALLAQHPNILIQEGKDLELAP